MTNYSNGHKAERVAANYLQSLGFFVVATNWRTRFCEIDIIAQKADAIFFVEVKYRENNSWGSGLEYITDKKLQQMQFAAEFWVHDNNWSGDYFLSAVEVTGHDYKISNFIESID